MRTRAGVYPANRVSPVPAKKRRTGSAGKVMAAKPEVELVTPAAGAPAVCGLDLVCGFDSLHDDILRFLSAAKHPLVFLNAAPGAFPLKVSKWSEGAHRFLNQCADAGNMEACYTLGMIHFYCLKSRAIGSSLLVKAAGGLHPASLLSLSLVQFNGSGRARKDKNLTSGFSLCARAASLGYVDAIRELAYCLYDGYGVVRDVSKGRRLLLEANARAAAATLAAPPLVFFETALQMSARCNGCFRRLLGGDLCSQSDHQTMDFFLKTLVTQMKRDGHASDTQRVCKLLEGGGSFLLSDFGCPLPPPPIHVANKFLVDWFHLYPPTPGLRICSHSNCGRPETRKYEFRGCSACSSVKYCSRTCQALDWKLRHKYQCKLVGP